MALCGGQQVAHGAVPNGITQLKMKRIADLYRKGKRHETSSSPLQLATLDVGFILPRFLCLPIALVFE